ncbi:TD and POZ domain-containing protein 3 [Argiope bruennichi]|uniref:TD and POZ domain-containing protein 3 n=1 Tax=Argiope bruennichi TaxID=94029 RepID=A0A8T0EDI0_ARGBR|nr:TD and POZ domain-containing protein 3 [Argiope bruennichi]
MFLSIDMKEKASECVNISDLSSDTVRRMLLFLYMDFVEELDFTSAKELYFAADKYDIISLKHRCSLCMQQNLCLSNVCEVLFLADMHQDQDLKSAVHDYIQKNDKKVFASEEWKLFMEKNMTGASKALNCWLQARDDSLYSPQFLAESLMNTRWKLKLSPKWHLAEKYISLSLQRDVEDDGPEQISLKYELSFLASNGSHLKSKSYLEKFAVKTVSHELNVKQVEILKEKNEDYLPEGVLTVRCKLWKSWSTVSKGGKCSIQSVIGTRCIELDGTIDTSCSQRKPPFIKVCVFKSYNWYGLRSNNFFQDNKIKLKLRITFYPSIESENVQYELDKNLTCESTEHEDFHLEKLYSSFSDSPQHSELPDKSCDIEGNESTDEKECPTDIKMKSLPFTTLKEDLSSLHNDRLFCDTKLQTDTEMFPAHRCVLSARSPVFKKMFTTDMKERAGESINVPDISSDTLRRMLQFLYTIGSSDMFWNF